MAAFADTLAAPAAPAELSVGVASADAAADQIPSVVMILSPRMVSALEEWPRMRRAAEQLGFVVIGVRDPRVGDAEWRSAIVAAGRPDALALPVLTDPAIERLGVLNHSPTSVVRLAGRVHPWPILGVMPDQAWTTVLKQRLEQLRVAP